MEALFCAIVLFLGGAETAWAGDKPLLAVERSEVCPLLMTPAECGQHLESLKRLPNGRERDTYLAAHRALMLDREQACRCTLGALLPETGAIRR